MESVTIQSVTIWRFHCIYFLAIQGYQVKLKYKFFCQSNENRKVFMASVNNGLSKQ